MHLFTDISIHPDGRLITFASFVGLEKPGRVWVMENFLPATKQNIPIFNTPVVMPEGGLPGVLFLQGHRLQVVRPVFPGQSQIRNYSLSLTRSLCARFIIPNFQFFSTDSSRSCLSDPSEQSHPFDRSHPCLRQAGVRAVSFWRTNSCLPLGTAGMSAYTP